MSKEAQVVMLPTEGLGVIMSETGPYDTEMVVISELPENLRDHDRPHNHLYITTDDEIKEGDWFIWLKYNLVERATKKDNNKECRKIIATTDPKLYVNEIVEEDMHLYKKPLPKIPQSFIEEYCKAGGIDKVLVEYENIKKDRPAYVDHHGITILNGSDEITQLKLDSNNCIIIHPVEEKMYSASQVRKMFWDCHDGVLDENQLKWIKENL